MITKDKIIMLNDNEIHILDFSENEFNILENNIKGCSIEHRKVKGSENIYKVLIIKNIYFHEKIK